MTFFPWKLERVIFLKLLSGITVVAVKSGAFFVTSICIFSLLKYNKIINYLGLILKGKFDNEQVKL